MRQRWIRIWIRVTNTKINSNSNMVLQVQVSDVMSRVICWFIIFSWDFSNGFFLSLSVPCPYPPQSCECYHTPWSIMPASEVPTQATKQGLWNSSSGQHRDYHHSTSQYRCKIMQRPGLECRTAPPPPQLMHAIECVFCSGSILCPLVLMCSFPPAHSLISCV